MVRRPIALLLAALLFLFCYGCAASHGVNNSSINNFDRESEDDPEKWMEYTISALMADNPEILKPLFAANLQESDEFDSKLQSLMSYFNGDIQSYDIVLGRTYLSTHDGIVESDVGCDIKTTNASYRLAIKIRLTDKNDSRNEGIQSLYIINANDIAPDVGYWGNIVWLPGITLP